MKLLFLLFTFLLILTVHAQREFNEYTCLVSHEGESTPFYLNLGTRKRVAVGDKKVDAALQRKANSIEISLARTLIDVNNSNSRVERREYPVQSRKLLVELRHFVGGEEAHFMLECSPRDP